MSIIGAVALNSRSRITITRFEDKRLVVGRSTEPLRFIYMVYLFNNKVTSHSRRSILDNQGFKSVM